jgi:hypothetical protein
VKTSEHLPINVQLWELADVQLCIGAVEAVISEIGSDSAGRRRARGSHSAELTADVDGVVAQVWRR